ncbi:hypothetical protein AVEN_121256-1 [Araneus ventricosus]|uniref:CCHC-type domain-containing protein n=1 Tax=Araneus ventricosus TaxID=182803 RepID=A0A4Y2R1R9_ARAVE|nr:hypothetical protein AVEN_121256-1 [Araneus ventricosus]
MRSSCRSVCFLLLMDSNIPPRVGRAWRPTQHVILTFSTPELPKAIRAGYLHCSVRAYIPNPLRCFKCQRFGHSQPACRGTLRCAETGHESSTCISENLKCPNCSGSHAAFS